MLVKISLQITYQDLWEYVPIVLVRQGIWSANGPIITRFNFWVALEAFNPELGKYLDLLGISIKTYRVYNILPIAYR